jgi:predicted RND superfamily exporter protein
MISFLKIKKSKRSKKLSHSWEKWAKIFSIVTKTRRWPFIIGSLVIFAVSIAGVTQIGFESDQINYFKESNEVRQANNMADKWFDGIYPVELVFTLPEDIYQSDDAHKYYAFFDSLETEIAKIETVKTIHSPLVFFNSLFPNKIQQQQVLAMLNSESEKDIKTSRYLAGYLAEDGQHYRMSLKTKWLNNEETISLINSLNSTIKPRLENTDIDFYTTGLAPMYVRLNERLLGNQIRSFAFCFLLIFIILLFLFRQGFLAVIGLLPNLLPVITTMGIMGWLGISLDIATILIAAISLGIAVDDTIHFLTAYKQNRMRHISIRLRIQRTFEKVGRPITLTSILLVCGFMIMVFSTYVPFVYFGVFLSLNIAFAYLYGLVLLPAILYLFPKYK